MLFHAFYNISSLILHGLRIYSLSNKQIYRDIYLFRTHHYIVEKYIKLADL